MSLRSEGIPKGLKTLLIVSAVAHSGFFATFILVSAISNAEPPPPKNMVAVKILRLGKKRDENLLPRVPTRPPPATNKAAPPVPSSKPSPVPAQRNPASPKSALDRAKEIGRVSSALDRLRKVSDEEPEGDPEGVEGGNTTDPSATIGGSIYLAKINLCFENNFTVQGASKRKVQGLKTEVFLRIQADGRLTDARIKRTKVAAFDQAVERAVKKCSKGGAVPPKELRAAFLQGINIIFEP